MKNAAIGAPGASLGFCLPKSFAVLRPRYQKYRAMRESPVMVSVAPLGLGYTPRTIPGASSAVADSAPGY